MNYNIEVSMNGFSQSNTMDDFSHTAVPDDAVVSRPLGSRLDIVTNPDGSTSGVCQVVSLNPFSWNSAPSDEDNYVHEIYYIAQADYLAVKHLNEGDGSLVKELEGLNETCNIRFGLEYINEKFFDPQLAGHIVLDRVGAINTETDPEQSDSYEFNPCFFNEGLPYGSSTSVTSFLTGIHGYTVVSGMVADPQFGSERELYPKFAGTMAANHGIARAIVDYVRKVLKTRFMAILYLDEPSSISAARDFRAEAYRGNNEKEFQIEFIPMDRNFQDIEKVVSGLKRLRFNTVVAILPEVPPHLGTEALMKEALKQGLAGNGEVTWIFHVSCLSALTKLFPEGSSLYQAYRGSGVAVNFDSKGPDHFKFLDALNTFQSKEDEFQYFLSMLPGSDQINATVDDYKEYGRSLTAWMRYKYDATVLAGLAACRAVDKSLYLDKDEFFKTIANTEFQGATGFVKLRSDTVTRIANTTVVTMLNFHDLDESYDDQYGGLPFQFNPVGKFKNNEWQLSEEFEFIFSGGSSQPPQEIPLIYDDDVFELRTVTVVVASLLCAIPILFALGCAIWTRLNQHKRIVRASQPFFLYFIAAGTIIFASSIVPLTYDLTRTSHAGMMIACNAFLWLALIGVSVVLSAFFAKTHRIVEIMKASERCKRVTITIRDAVVPMAIVLTCA